MNTRLSAGERLLSIATRIIPGEGRSTWMLIAGAFLILYSHYLLKVVRDTLILASGSAVDKSFANALSALTLTAVLAIYALFYAKYKNQHKRITLTLIINGFFAINMLLFMGLILLDWNTPMIFYVWQSIYGVLVVSHFWSFCADLMNQKTGQRLFPPIMVGAALGAWSGSISSDWFFNHWGTAGVMMAALLCLMLSTRLSNLAEKKLPDESQNHTWQAEEESPKASPLAGFKLIITHKYLIFVALFVLLMNWINSTGEYIFADFIKQAAEASVANGSDISEEKQIASYYSSYYTWVSLTGFLLQTFLVSRLFRWIGIKGSMLVLPVVMIMGYGLMVILPIFAIARATMIVENATSYSIANTTRNALFLPLDRDEKYLGKTTIDTLFWRLGDLLQFAVIAIGVNLLSWATTDFIWFNLVLSILMLVVTLQIFRQYKHHQSHHQGSAPSVNRKLPILELTSGMASRSKLPEDLFYDPDPGDALRYFLTTHDGLPPPAWIKFNPHHLFIVFTPPAGEQGELNLKLKVTDVDELSCEVDLHIRWAEQLNLSDGVEPV